MPSPVVFAAPQSVRSSRHEKKAIRVSAHRAAPVVTPAPLATRAPLAPFATPVVVSQPAAPVKRTRDPDSLLPD